MRHIRTSTLLRNNWPELGVIACLCFWIIVWLICKPRPVEYDPSKQVSYWSLITPSMSVPVLILAIGVSFIVLWKSLRQLWKINDTLVVGMFEVMALLACSGSLLFMLITITNLWMFTSSIEHVQTISVSDKSYHLARSRLWDEDHEYGEYIIFQCNASGDICQELEIASNLTCGYMDQDVSTASLKTNDKRNELLLDCDGYVTPLAAVE